MTSMMNQTQNKKLVEKLSIADNFKTRKDRLCKCLFDTLYFIHIVTDRPVTQISFQA